MLTSPPDYLTIEEFKSLAAQYISVSIGTSWNENKKILLKTPLCKLPFGVKQFDSVKKPYDAWNAPLEFYMSHPGTQEFIARVNSFVTEYTEKASLLAQKEPKSPIGLLYTASGAVMTAGEILKFRTAPPFKAAKRKEPAGVVFDETIQVLKAFVPNDEVDSVKK